MSLAAANLNTAVSTVEFPTTNCEAAEDVSVVIEPAARFSLTGCEACFNEAFEEAVVP